MRKLQPAGQFSQGRSSPFGGSQLVNCYAEMSGGDKKETFAVMAIPGLVQFANVGAGAVRGRHVMNGVLYVVIGLELYRFDSTGAGTLVGSVPGTDRVRMADNGTQIAICADSLGYIATTSSVTQIADADFPLVSDIDYIDDYFLWTRLDTGQFTISSLLDGTAYDALDVATAEGGPDNLIGVIVDHRQVLLFGTDTIEIWYNADATDFPFVRQGNAFIERGCLARDSITKLDNSVFFVGDDRVIYRVNGYTPVAISNPAIEYAIRDAAASSFSASTYSQEGHKFYVLSTDAGTYVYDVTTNLWHERISTGKARWRADFLVHVYDKVLAGNFESNLLYSLSLDAFDENAESFQTKIVLPVIHAERELVTMYSFEVDLESGVGLATGQGSDPQMALRYSDDGGRTWSGELWRSLGATGAYKTRAVWRTLGQFRQRQIELSMTDPVRRFVIGYWADIQ